jgi:formate-dependent nitrite reductase membrane component NrfD
MNRFGLAHALFVIGLFAGVLLAQSPLQIPQDQPICRLYGMIQVLGTVAGVLVAAYAGFILASSNEIEERNKAKHLIAGVITGLIIIWIAPLVVKSLVGATDVCGW